MLKIRATAVVFRDGKILLIHRLRDGQDYYVLPGGKVEDGETIETAVIRELTEETSIMAKLGEKLISFDDAEGRNHQLFQCAYLSGEPRLAENSVEQVNTDKNNQYLPLWFELKDLNKITMWPEGTKEFLIENLAYSLPCRV